MKRSGELFAQLQKLHGDKLQQVLAAQLATLRWLKGDEPGVSLFDVAFAVEEDDAAAKVAVKKWIDSKQILARPLGKCPLDGRRSIYHLSEVLRDVSKILGFTPSEQARLKQALTAKLRCPSQK